MDDFVFELSDEEKRYLKDLAYLSIKARLEGQEIKLPGPPSEKLNEHFWGFCDIEDEWSVTRLYWAHSW